jgi:membrane protein DedA with SNARE-associated domain
LLHKITAVLVAFGPLGVFLLSIADSLGIPLPAAMDVLLITVGAASVRNPRHAYLTALLAVVGSVIGNVALFMAARHGSRWIAKREPPAGRQRQFKEWFHRYGFLTVFIPTVTPIVPLPLKVFVISAGALHAPFGKFLVVIVVARVIRYFGEVFLGIQLEADAQGFLIRNGWTLAGIALGCALAVYATMRAIDRRKPATME